MESDSRAMASQRETTKLQCRDTKRARRKTQEMNLAIPRFHVQRMLEEIDWLKHWKYVVFIIISRK